LGGQEWKINCNKCGLGHTIKFNDRDLSSLLQNGFIDIGCDGNGTTNIPRIPWGLRTSGNFFEQRKPPPSNHTTRITLHSMIQNYLK
jgi:hypothetical protein